ncbi:hypothetical protein TNCV_2045181 [Trichonephila clavipes]|uniref:Uncharacterized protein n=1 Tax=Trichonephila clavipes TaxID=2585209 RepID=A0A8X6VLW6_TRICX|nr:hypothetical protein TNCV_2045181 [Trichonephila clavipes]
MPLRRQVPFAIVLKSMMGGITYAENADIHYMYVSANANGKVALRMYNSFLTDECQITEFFSGSIFNFVKHVCFQSPDMMLIDKELFAVQAWKKTS